MEMEVGDCTLWHYLIFCEELVSDNYKNDFICWVCKEPLSGNPTFKCLECDFVQHKSCSQLPNLTEMDVKHDITKRHHLFLREEIENNGKKEAVCLGCGKQVSGPTYRCFVPQCSFHLHKSCDQLSHAIQHIRHPNHILLLQLPSPTVSCDLCRRHRKKDPLLYGCRICNFDVDIKCLLHWDIIESERKMEAKDCSLWHYLIFCEEFVSDNCEKDLHCWVCEELVSGHPVFKCLECGFVQHKSCTQLPDLTEMDITHDFIDRHHLILQDEMEDNSKEEVVCAGCGEVASGPAYRCSIPKCIFHLHKSCDQLSHAIHNIKHPEHTLILQLPPGFSYCDLCGESVERTTLLYHCSVCQFDMDKNCAFPVQIINVDCDQHVFIARRKPMHFTCDACGVETMAVASQCSICGILTHHYCTRFPRIIKIKAHNHLFSRTYCLREVKKLENTICKLCCKKVNIECGAYYCQVCDYIVHMKCAKQNQDKSIINSEGIEFEDYRRHLVYLVEGLNAKENRVVDVSSRINHKNHPQHELILKFEDSVNDKQLYKNDKRCVVCMQFIIFPPFYSCEDCNIFVHKRCAKLPETVRRPEFGKNPYTLSSRLLSSTDNLFKCGICNYYRHGLFYESEGNRLDVQCFLIPQTISHKSHKHLLNIPLLVDYGLKEICSGCGGKIIGTKWHLMCSDCKFWLCFKCAILPLV